MQWYEFGHDFANVREDDWVVKCLYLSTKGGGSWNSRFAAFLLLVLNIYSVRCHVIVVVDSIYNKFVQSEFKWAPLLFGEPC